MQEMGIGPTVPISIYSDSQSAINLAHNPVFHEKSKHVALKYHFTRWLIDERQLSLEYVPTEVQVADCLTKALSGPKLALARKFQGLVELSEEAGDDVSMTSA